MLEDCPDLPACELILSEAVKGVHLLGEIPLSDSDIEILANFIRQKIIASSSRGTAYLKTKTPTCFVCFLVGMGRFYDKQAGYWPIVEEKVGLIDINWKVKWGKIFIQYLEDNDLPRFDEEEGLAYVTPILGHACIPDCCLDEYFDRVLVPLINHDLLKPLDQQEILHDLRVRRKINESRIELEKKRKEHNEWLKELQQEKKGLRIQFEKYKEVASLLAEEGECERKKIALRGLENAEHTREVFNSHITENTENIQRLETEGKRLWEQITAFSQRYQPILEAKSQIDDAIRIHTRINEELPEALENKKRILTSVITEWAKLSREPWNDSFGVEILRLPLEQLLSQIEQYQYLQEKQKTIQEKIENLEALQKEAKKPPALVLSVLMFIRKTLIWIGRKSYIPQPSELQQLQGIYSETSVEMQQGQMGIKGLFTNLPVEERLLDNPTSDFYEGLCSLKLMHLDYVEAHQKQIKLEEEGDQLTGQVQDLASFLDIIVDGNSSTWVNRLCEVLQEAHQSRANALEVKGILEKEIRPVLEATRLEYHSLREDIEMLDQQLAELGGGAFQQGLNLVQEFHQYHVAVVQTRQNLSSLYQDFASLESELRKQGFEAISISLEKTAAEVDKRIQATKSELKYSEKGLDNHPFQYFGIDEPIRRLLLYGGCTAEKYLVNSVMLFARAKSGEKVEDISDVILPNRITQHFQQWWDYYQTEAELKSTLEEEVNPATGERYRAPQIFFDAATGEVIAKLPSQHFLRPESGMTVQLDVFGCGSINPLHTLHLKLYNRTGGLVETHSCDDIVLTIPSEKYLFRLKTKDNSIREWEIKGPNDRAPFLAFSPSSYKLVKEENIPRSPLIVVIHKGLRIHPQECILTEGGILFGGWKDYAWYEVDLSTVEEFCLSDDVGQSLTIPLTSELVSGIALIEGNKIIGVSSDERVVYNLSPEFIRIPVKDRDSLHLFKFSIYWDDENHSRKPKHYQIDELVDLIYDHNESWIDIPLNAEQILGKNPFGCFTLRVYRPSHFDWQLSFCTIPQFKVLFDQEMYLPFLEKIPNVIATLNLPEKSTFKPDSPAKLISRDAISSILQTPASENDIAGMILCSTGDGKGIDIPITLSIPKVRWRLQGLGDHKYDQWLDEVEEELWIGDWIEAQELFLVVETPWFFHGNVSLVLPENGISAELRRIHDQIIRVDLKALEDTLRAGPSIEKVTISLNNTITKITDILLFTVRTRWLAEKIRCFHYPEGDGVRLDVFWQEKGKSNKKAVRLWYLSGDQPKLIQEQLVPQDVHEAVFRSSAVQVNTGIYLVHLEPYDPWSSKPICPKLNDPNTVIIEIVTKAPEKVVTIQSVGVDERHNYPLPQYSYRIHIIGKVINQKLPENLDIEDIDHVLIAPFNENWYVGNLEVKGKPEVIAHLSDTNPVKFEYDTQKRVVTFIEDRHGDGAVYCYDCNMLFWHQETVINEKKKHGKHNYLPIEFRIIWKSEE